MSATRFSRRSFLASAGLGASLVPMLAGHRGTAWANGEARPKRLVVIGVPNGYKSDYLPVVDGATWKAKDTEFSPLKPLEPFRERVLVIGGLNIQNGIDTAREVKADPRAGIGGHAILPFLLTGAKGVPGPSIPDGWKLSSGYASVDQHVAKHMPGNKGRPFESLVLRPVRLSANGYGNQPLSYSGKCLDGRTHNAPSMRDDPTRLFDELFGGNADSSTLEKIRAQRKSLLDFTGQQVRALHAKVSREDKVRLDQHLDGIARIEKQLDAAAGGGACKKGDKPDPAIWSTTSNSPNLHLVMRAQIEMTVAAMACDVTRVASHLWCSSNNNTITFPFLAEHIPSLNEPWTGKETAGSGNTFRNHHTIAHNDGILVREKNLTDRFFIENFAYLLKLLSETRDPDGKPMLDNTLVLFANMQRTGGGHQTDNVIWFLAGNCDGYFKTGRYIPWASGTAGRATPTNGVLTAVVNATGCPRQEFFADPAYGGELPILRG